ncbi:FAD-dependent oxidoreductase [Chondromyces apiculatus]|uniref:Glutamate synthase [NADPH] small chain n=1 Tax=Chondromyces apiculatus DSM 436 TaxID=1192034 RepID=A0A017TFH4_9BACT|nr:FAD-dependent oxidoreductase [Chondromyces apiculatus]EYF07994.1 Glutamate synthase [NADPH] small chain [Chondromyces apiculatus DSM 436]
MEATPGLQTDFSAWVQSTSEPSDLILGLPGFTYPDLFAPARLAELSERFDAAFQQADPEAFARFDTYRGAVRRGVAVPPEQTSEALLAAAPHVSRFVARLFGVEREVQAMKDAAGERSPLWQFKKEFAKKRLFKANVGRSWPGSPVEAAHAARRALAAMGAMPALLESGSEDEELAVARATLLLLEVDDVARKAAKAGGAAWTEELHARAAKVREALGADPVLATITVSAVATAGPTPSDAEDAAVVTFALDALEAWLGRRRGDEHDPARRWPTLKAPHTLDYQQLVQLRRKDESLPELFVGPDHERREREGFALTDRRAPPREVESEVDYCLFCHDRDKDSCSKGLRDNKTGAIKPNPLGVPLNGCPLCEKISEMHVMRQGGDSVASIALVCIDNPMLPGTGHRICNDCMKACVYQKQEPVNIPQIETAVLTDVLGLPWGLEIYGLLTRWNPLNVLRPHAKPYNGKNVLVVGLGPAGYTLSHHLSREGFAVAAIDGLKIEPLPAELIGDETHPPRPVRDFRKLYVELDERVLLGFGGVSEYGITVRWDKNFLTVLYITLARQRLLRIYGGVRFGGTVDVDDAWRLGFDHVAIAAGAGRPTLIQLKNNLSRGIRKASDFLMALQLSGAYKRSSLANLQVRLPAVVIGGGLTAIDTCTELLAYYVIQVEKTAARVEALIKERGEASVMALFDEEERAFVTEQLAHAAALREERALAAREGRAPRLQPLLDGWGGVSLVYRKRLIDSPAYRLNHEEVAKSLEEGVRYVENMAPIEATLDAHGAVNGMIFERQALVEGKWRSTGEHVTMPARTVCVAAGTSPNVTYEKEYPGHFTFDKWKQFFQAHRAWVDDAGALHVEPSDPQKGFFTSYNDGKHAVSFYGDNHPFYAGSVVKAMASAKDAFPSVVELFRHDIARLDAEDAEPQAARDARRRDLFARLDHEFVAVVERVERLTPTIIEVVVRAPAAARKFEPGQFYRLQNFEASSPFVNGTRLAMEGLALTGAWVDKEKGLLSMIALEMGVSSRLIAMLKQGQEVVVMGPTGTPTEIPERETLLLAGGGLGNAVLFSIAKALRARGDRVIYFAGYRMGEDLFKQEEIEVATDQVIWCTDAGKEITPRRPADRHFRGNIVQAMVAYAEGRLGGEAARLSEVNRIIAIGSDRMMNAVREARHGILAPHLNPRHLAIASINSPMQCMMKEICAQCLQKHVDPETGAETVVFTCYNQDQPLDRVDFRNLASRLRLNSAQEKLANAWFEQMMAHTPGLLRV